MGERKDWAELASRDLKRYGDVARVEAGLGTGFKGAVMSVFEEDAAVEVVAVATEPRGSLMDGGWLRATAGFGDGNGCSSERAGGGSTTEVVAGVGGGDLKATFLVTSDAALLLVPLRAIAAGGSMAGRTGSTSRGGAGGSGRGASWVESCEGMISGNGLKTV